MKNEKLQAYDTNSSSIIHTAVLLYTYYITVFRVSCCCCMLWSLVVYIYIYDIFIIVKNIIVCTIIMSRYFWCPEKLKRRSKVSMQCVLVCSSCGCREHNNKKKNQTDRQTDTVGTDRWWIVPSSSSTLKQHPRHPLPLSRTHSIEYSSNNAPWTTTGEWRNGGKSRPTQNRPKKRLVWCFTAACLFVRAPCLDSSSRSSIVSNDRLWAASVAISKTLSLEEEELNETHKKSSTVVQQALTA